MQPMRTSRPSGVIINDNDFFFMHFFVSIVVVSCVHKYITLGYTSHYFPPKAHNRLVLIRQYANIITITINRQAAQAIMVRPCLSSRFAAEDHTTKNSVDGSRRRGRPRKS